MSAGILEVCLDKAALAIAQFVEHFLNFKGIPILLEDDKFSPISKKRRILKSH